MSARRSTPAAGRPDRRRTVDATWSRAALAEDLAGGVDVTSVARPCPADQTAAGRPGRPGRRRGRRAAGGRGGVRRSSARAGDRRVAAARRRPGRPRRRAGHRRPARPGRCSPPSAPRSTCSATCPASPRSPRRGPTRSPAPGAGPRHPQDHARACGRWRSTRCAAAAASTTGCACPTPRWSRTTTCVAAGGVGRGVRAVRDALPGPAGRGRGATPLDQAAGGGRGRRRPRAARQHDARPSCARPSAASAGRARAGGDRRADPGRRPRRSPRPASTTSSVGALTHSAPVLDIALDLRTRRRAETLMLLAIDVGNTNTVLGRLRRRQLVAAPGGSRPTPGAPPTSSPLMLRGLLRRRAEVDRHRRLLDRAGGAARAARDAGALLRRRARGDRRAGRHDRRAAALSTTRRRSAPTGSSTRWPRTTSTAGRAIVVDFGTSTNFDVVSGQGRVPRRRARARASRSRVDALAARAAQLRKVELARPRVGDRQEHGRGAAVGHPLRLRRPGRRAGPRGSRPSWARPGRGDRHRRAGPAGGRASARRSRTTSPSSR